MTSCRCKIKAGLALASLIRAFRPVERWHEELVQIRSLREQPGEIAGAGHLPTIWPLELVTPVPISALFYPVK